MQSAENGPRTQFATGIVGVAVPELSSLLDSSRLFASQKCHQSQGTGGLWSQNPELSLLLDSARVFTSQKCCHRDPAGRGRETQNCRHFFKSVNSQRDRGGRGREAQNCRHFWARLASSVSRVSTVTGIGGVVVAKPRTVVTSGFVSSLRVSKCQQSQGQGGRGRETQNRHHFWTCRSREERREGREEGREESGERREERGDRREERGERREEKGERGERREERTEKREVEEKEEKGMTTNLRLLSGFACGMSLSLHVRVTCLRSGSWLLSVFLL